MDIHFADQNLFLYRTKHVDYIWAKHQTVQYPIFFSHLTAFQSCCKYSAVETVICNYTAFNNGHIPITPHL